jgi:hypothetical protein
MACQKAIAKIKFLKQVRKTNMNQAIRSTGMNTYELSKASREHLEFAASLLASIQARRLSEQQGTAPSKTGYLKSQTIHSARPGC